MNTVHRFGLAAAWFLPLLGGCAASSGTTPAPEPAPAQPAPSSQAAPVATSASAPPAEMSHNHHMHGLPPATIPAGALITEADVHFMQGMIGHHGQAIHMSRLATTRGANPRLLRFAEKIDQSQASEIMLMQDWLRANAQFAPDAESWRSMTMPGMLTEAELATLEASRGREFDRQFLTLMIRHHEGALRMVADLLAAPRAAQDVDISVFANDVETTQTAEIGLMYQMLNEL